MSEINTLSQTDYLWGADAIANYLGLTERQVRYREEQNLMPIGRLGNGSLYASKTALDAFLKSGLPAMEANDD